VSLPIRSRLSAGVLVRPGVVWLGSFFLLPLAIIAVFSLGSVDPSGHVTLADPSLRNYEQALQP
jgi:ABC-type spermidine/putrescine transport system permease subunit I